MDHLFVEGCAGMYARGECTAGEAMKLCVDNGMTAGESVYFIKNIIIEDKTAADIEARARRYIQAMGHIKHHLTLTLRSGERCQ